MKVHRYGIHTGEEPGIIGNDRSGMVVFAGCHLRCSFCYTPEAAFQAQGQVLDLSQVFESLLQQGARNLNFITPSHVWNDLKVPLTQFRELHPSTPIILKVSGYEGGRLAKEFSELADVIVMDFKVSEAEAARAVCLPAKYGTVAESFLREVSGRLPTQYTDGKISRGVVVRTLWLPGVPTASEEANRIGQRLVRAGHRGVWNVMRFFINPQTRGLDCAPQGWTEALVDKFPALEIWQDGRPVTKSGESGQRFAMNQSQRAVIA